MSESIKYLNEENFEDTIKKGVTLVDFYASWCGPCKMIAPLVEELAVDVKGQATVAKLDIDKAQDVTRNYDVTSIPTIVLFKDGKEVKRCVGIRDKEFLRQMIDSAL